MVCGMERGWGMGHTEERCDEKGRHNKAKHATTSRVTLLRVTGATRVPTG